jgi:hypothetical protein
MTRAAPGSGPAKKGLIPPRSAPSASSMAVSELAAACMLSFDPVSTVVYGRFTGRRAG